jgi:hypothetical protein
VSKLKQHDADANEAEGDCFNNDDDEALETCCSKEPMVGASE